PADGLGQLAVLFHDHQAKLEGRTPITAADLNRAEKLGAQLLGLLRPVRGPRKSDPPRVLAAIDVRDRMWTMLVQRHLLLQRAAGWLWATELEQHTPSLFPRGPAPRRKKDATPAEP